MGHDVEGARIDRCLDVIYDAAAGRVGWQAALGDIADLFRAGFVDLFTRTNDSRHFNGLAVGLDRGDYHDVFLNVWFKRNVWGRAKPVRVAGEVLSTRQMVDRAELCRSEIYTEYLQSRGLHEGLRLSLWAGERDIGDISILRPWSMGAFGPAEVALGHALLPHLQRAVAVTRRLRASDFCLETGEGGAGTGGVAAIAFDRAGRPFWFNAAAEATLSRGTLLTLVDDALHGPTPAATRDVSAAVAQAVGPAQRRGGAAALPRPAGLGSVNMVVLPLSHRDDWAMVRPPAAVAFLRDPAAASPPRDALRGLFGLTAAEGELAQDLLAGSSLAEVAARTGRSLNTLRTHLARLMEKTGTGRQVELVRLLGEVAAFSPAREVPVPGDPFSPLPAAAADEARPG